MEELLCPHCQTPLQIERSDEEQQANCPECGGEFSIPAAEVESKPEEKLDAIRIRQLSAARRAAYRARSYCLVGALFCLATAGQFAWSAYSRWHGKKLSAIGFVTLSILGVWGGIYFLARARALHEEAKGTPISEPQTPPDFSTLSDGSDRVQKLEEM